MKNITAEQLRHKMSSVKKQSIKKVKPSNSKSVPQTYNTDTTWFQLKLKARGLNQTTLANALGVHKSHASLMLRGKRRMSAKDVSVIANLLNVDPGEVIARSGVDVKPVENDGELKIHGWVDGELTVYIEPPKGPQTAPRPIFAGSKSLCLRLQTNGSKLSPLDGGLIYYTEQSTNDTNFGFTDILDRLCVVELEDKIVVRCVKRGYEKDRFNLYNLSDVLIESNATIKIAHPVIYLKFK